MSGIAAVGTKESSGVGGLFHDMGNLFRPPPPLPSVEERVATILAQIRAAHGPVVLWVPGTSEHTVPDGFTSRVKTRMPSATVVLVPYQATWRFHDSVPDGDAVLAGVLAGLAHTGSTQRVLLAGESQGTWVISDTLAQPALQGAAAGAALLAHPGVAVDHAGGPTLPASVREFNSQGDVVSHPMRSDRERHRVVNLIDNFSRLHILRALGGAVGLIVTDPGLIGGLIGSQLFRFKRGSVDPHNTEDRWTAAVDHLAQMAGV